MAPAATLLGRPAWAASGDSRDDLLPPSCLAADFSASSERSPFVTVQGGLSRLLGATRGSSTSGGGGGPRHDPAGLRRIWEDLQPLDSPVDFAVCGKDADTMPARPPSAVATRHRSSNGGGDASYRGVPCPVRVVPLSSGWFDSDGFSPRDDSAGGRDAELLGFKRPGAVPADAGCGYGSMSSQQRVCSTTPDAGQQQSMRWQQQQQQQQQRGGAPPAVKQQSVSRLNKLLSWGNGALQLGNGGSTSGWRGIGRRVTGGGAGQAAGPPPPDALLAMRPRFCSDTGSRVRSITSQQQQQQQQQQPSHPLSWAGLRRLSTSSLRSSFTGASGRSFDAPCLLKGDGCSSEGDTLEDEAPLALPLSPQIQRAAPQLLQRPRLLTSPTRLGGNCGLQCSSSCPQTPVGMMRRTAPAGQPPRSPLGQLPACSVGCGSRTLLQQQQYHPRRSSLEGGRSHACSGGEQPGAGLRIALARLDFAQASARAARLVDRLASGLGRVASLLPDGVLRQPVGREVMRDWEFVGPQLGVGSSCVTRLVLARSDGSPAACKSISKTCLSRSAAARAAVLGMQRELAILQHTIGHPHVVQLRRVYEDARALHLVLEWCGGGCLEAALDVAPSGRLPEASAAAVMVAVLEVLALCHERGVMHRDIKPGNILLIRPLEEDTPLTADAVKVTDFGISLPFTAGKPLSELAGTLDYMAPELLARCYSASADVWSAGIMLHELLTGRLPYAGDTPDELLRDIESRQLDMTGPLWAGVSDEARQLVGLMLLRDPQLRPSARQLLTAFSGWLDLGRLA